jgi:F-type H+-transporting ATPase subunit delta
MSQVSRRYAKALHLIALEDKSVETIEGELVAFDEMVRSSDELQSVLADPTVLPSAKKSIVDSIVAKIGFSQTMQNFIGLLGEKGRLGLFSEIRDWFARFADEQAGRVRATVTSAAPLAKEMEASLTDKLSKMAGGRKVELESKVDPKLLAGLVAEIDGVVYDGSLRTQLQSLRERARSS